MNISDTISTTQCVLSHHFMSAYQVKVGHCYRSFRRQDPGHYLEKDSLKEIMLQLDTASGALFENYNSCFSYSASGSLFGKKSL